MISKVGIYSGIKFAPTFKTEKKEEQNKSVSSDIQQENKGLEALASYNEAMVKKEVYDDKLNIKPIPPILPAQIDIEKMEGEKIYSSDGQLKSVVRRDENTYTVFTPDKENLNSFSLIEVFRKDSNKYPIKTQTSGIYNNIPYIYINEYDSKTGENTKSTRYSNDKVESISQTYNTPDGKTIDVSYDYIDKNYYTYITYKNNKDREIYARFNDDKQLLRVNESNKTKNGIIETSVEFYNGAPYKIEKHQEYIIPNNIGKELTNNINPADYFNKIENIKDIEGERTYYSNGALETNTFDSDSGKVTAHFLPDGSCDNIKSADKEIYFENEKETIKEPLSDGKTKETIWYKDGEYSVKTFDDTSYKTASFSEKKIINHYEEGTIENGVEKDIKWMSFNEEGMLTLGC